MNLDLDPGVESALAPITALVGGIYDSLFIIYQSNEGDTLRAVVKQSTATQTDVDLAGSVTQ